MKKTALELVAQAKERVENLNPDQVAKELEAGALLVDIREPEERKESSIPGSIFAPRGMLEFYADSTLPYHKEEFTPDSEAHPSLRRGRTIGAGGCSAVAFDESRKSVLPLAVYELSHPQAPARFRG